MKRIILATLAVALTACSEGAGEPANGTPAPATSAERATPAVRGLAADRSDAATGAGGVAQADSPGVVLFVGTSLTAGYGVGADRAYPAVIQQRIQAAGLPYRVSNAGISGETSAGGLSRIDWALEQPVEVLVLELGANDGLRGLDIGQLESNLDAIIRRTQARHPDAEIVLVGMEAPPNLGERYTSRFRQVFRSLASEHDAALVPFLLEGVAMVDSLNQADRMHPTAAGQRVLAANVWAVLGPLLEARAQRASSDSP